MFSYQDFEKIMIAREKADQALMAKSQRIGSIENDEGGLRIYRNEDRCFWFIDSTYPITEADEEEIPQYLFDALMRFEAERIK
jgi:hypothetical protein